MGFLKLPAGQGIVVVVETLEGIHAGQPSPEWQAHPVPCGCVYLATEGGVGEIAQNVKRPTWPPAILPPSWLGSWLVGKDESVSGLLYSPWHLSSPLQLFSVVQSVRS